MIAPAPPLDVLVRVYDRMDDLQVCLEVIRKHWTRHDCRVLVVSNGLSGGHEVPDAGRALADAVLELDTNPGHMGGSSQLLCAGLPLLADDGRRVVLIEADTWMFDDGLIERYRRRMRDEGAVWASAEWEKKSHSLAVDFAIADVAFLKANPQIFDFDRGAETHVCNTLRNLGAGYLMIGECMPVHVPKLLRAAQYPHGRRVQGFIRAQMVTHHIENLPGGLTEKKALANVVLGRNEFDVPELRGITRRRFRFLIAEWLARIVPRSTWFRRKRVIGNIQRA